MNQSEHKANTCSQQQVQEKADIQVTIGNIYSGIHLLQLPKFILFFLFFKINNPSGA